MTEPRPKDTAKPLNPQLELIGNMMSTPQSVVVADNVAAVTSDANLVLLDISDPTFPRMVSQLILPTGLTPQERQGIFLDDVAIANDHAYVTWRRCPYTCEDGGLQVVNISVPTAPVVVGSLAVNTTMGNVAVLSSTLYINTGGDLGLVDVTNPAAPSILGTLALDGQYATVETIQVHADGNGHVYAFASSTNGSLYVVDVTDSGSPTQIAAYEPPDACMKDIALVDSNQILYAYLPDCDAGLRVVDVTDPSSPTEVRTYSFGTGNTAYRIAATDQRVVIATDDDSPAWNTTLHTFDISHPATLTLVGTYSGAEYAWDMVIADNHLVIADNAHGVQFVDIFNLALPTEIGRLSTVKAYGDIAIDGHYLFVVDDSGLRVIDILNPVLPRYVAHFATPHALSVTLGAGYALVIDYEGGLWVIDISDATTPTQIGFTDTNMTSVSDVVIREGSGDATHAFIASRGCTPYGCPATLKVADLSNLAAPQVTDILADGRGISGMALSGDYAYATTGRFDSIDSDLLILDVSDPISVTIVSTTGLQEPTYDVDVANEYAYVATRDAIHIFDVSNPNAPVLTTSYTSVNTPNTIAVAGEFLYISDRYDQLSVLDISDPINPRLVETQLLPVENVEIVSVENLLVEEGFVYVLNNGLSIWRHRNDVVGRVRDVWAQPFAGVTVSAGPQGAMPLPDAPPIAASGLTGGYAVTGGMVGTHTLSAHIANYGTWPLTQTVDLGKTAQDRDFYIVARPISSTLQPGVTTTMSYLDTQRLPTEIIFPPESVSRVSTALLTPTMAFHRGDQRFVGNAFEFTIDNGTSEGSNLGDIPVQAKIEYSDLGVKVVDEESLLLMTEIDRVWVEATSLCATPAGYKRDLSNNLLSTSICNTGHFALFGKSYQLFFPVVVK